ncbi:Dna-Binding Protein Rfx8 [Manis pentadactyla]|nr:Dna-Binding Protein Rfx8 [Manis pentadactyla]
MALLADGYCNYCQDILQNVKNQELERVEDLLTSFWKSLQQDTVMLMSLPDVGQLFKCYDVQLYKGIEGVLLHDFLEDVSIQYLKSVRLFSKKLKLWLLNALEGFPALLQISKLEVPVMDLSAAFYQCPLVNNNMDFRQIQGVRGVETVLLTVVRLKQFNCFAGNINRPRGIPELSVFQSPSKCLQAKQKQRGVIKLAASFQLRWNFLLTTVSRALTLCHRDSFGSWHLFHLLLLEYVIHILQSCIEEEEEDDTGSHKEMLLDDQSLVQPDQALPRPPDASPAQGHESPGVDRHQGTLKPTGQGQSPVGVDSVVLRGPGLPGGHCHRQ